jgi:hypothetical protein
MGEWKQQESFWPPSWRVPHNFSDDVYSEYATVAVFKQDFYTKETKIFFPSLLWNIKSYSIMYLKL